MILGKLLTIFFTIIAVVGAFYLFQTMFQGRKTGEAKPAGKGVAEPFKVAVPTPYGIGGRNLFNLDKETVDEIAITVARIAESQKQA